MAQFWMNNDGLPLQFGTDKTRPDLGGDYVMFGPNRVFETYINLGATSFGSGAIQNPGLPLNGSWAGTNFGTAGIVSQTSLFPLQPTAPVTQASSAGLLTIVNPQLYIDQIDFEVVIAATAGTGGATGLFGIGLATINPSTGLFVKVTPNSDVQLMGAATNAKMAAGMHYTFYSDGSIFGTGGVTTANQPTAGSWLGAVPLVTNSITPLPTHAYVYATTTGGPYTGTNAGGLMKLRVYYNWYGVINQ